MRLNKLSSTVMLLGFLVGTIGINSAQALGTPQIVSINPPSGSPVGTNVCVRAKVNWDSDFRSMRIRFGNEGWQESAETEFERCFGTNGYTAGWYTIRAEVAKVGEGWDTATSTEARYELTANQPAPTNPPNISCSVDSFDVSPNPATVGDSINITGKGSCNTGVRATKIKIDGGDYYEIGSPTLVTSWGTGGISRGNYKVKFMVAGWGDDNWSSAASQTINLQLNDQNNPPPPSSSKCNITSIDTYPASPQAPGVKVKIIAAGNCDNGVRAWRVKIDGGIQYEFGASPNFTWTWDTGGWANGDHKVRVELAGLGDNNWTNIDSSNLSYNLASHAPPAADANSAFTTGDVIKIGNDIFVIIKEGSAIQRRLVPNPETLDALGISRSMINNMGFSDQALLTIGRGVDIPDVKVDPSGFATFKATFLPDLPPIVPNGQDNQTQPQDQQPKVPNTSPDNQWQVGTRVGLCAGAQIRSGSGFSYPTHTIVPENNWQVDIIGGPRHANGVTWWNISRKNLDGGGSGWVYLEQAGQCKSVKIQQTPEVSGSQTDNKSSGPTTTTPPNECWGTDCLIQVEASGPNQPNKTCVTRSCNWWDLACHLQNLISSVACSGTTYPPQNPSPNVQQTDNSQNNNPDLDAYLAKHDAAIGQTYKDGQCVTLARDFVDFPPLNGGAKQYVATHQGELQLLRDAAIEDNACYVVLFTGSGYDPTNGHTAVLYTKDSSSITVIEQNYTETHNPSCKDNNKNRWGVCSRQIPLSQLDDNTYILKGTCN